MASATYDTQSPTQHQKRTSYAARKSHAADILSRYKFEVERKDYLCRSGSLCP
jgi:hypothetical protein